MTRHRSTAKASTYSDQEGEWPQMRPEGLQEGPRIKDIVGNVRRLDFILSVVSSPLKWDGLNLKDHMATKGTQWI